MKGKSSFVSPKTWKDILVPVFFPKSLLHRILGTCMQFLGIALIAMLSSCQRYPKGVQQALKLAGNNAPELEKVIAHYAEDPKDSLKLRAAYFLIENMPGKFYYEGDLINHYYEFIARVDDPPSALDSIKKKYGAFNLKRLHFKLDIEELKAPFLINNIDMAFRVWKEQPWGKNVNFQQFCEYILPYRNGNEPPVYDRVEFYKKYNTVLDSVRARNGDILHACYAVNNALKKEGWSFFIEGGFLPYFSAHNLLNQRKGNCRDMVSKTIFVMRSLGIPVGCEFTPNWGNRNGGHMWNVVIDDNGKTHPFMGTENNDSRELEGGTHYTLAKVFLNTFSSQSYSEYLIENGGNDFPDFFKNRNIKDVTNEIGTSADITVNLSQDHPIPKKFAFLCVFDNVKWIPVDWGKVADNKVIFKNVLGNVVYLSAYYEKGKLIPASEPFIFTKTGQLRYLTSNRNKVESDTLFRKYPVFMKADFANHMRGGKMQAADDESFSNAKTIYVIPYPEVEMKWYNVQLKLKRQYRFYRYLSPKRGWGNIAELQFYANGDRVNGDPIGTPGSVFNKPENFFTTAFDGDEATFFNYKDAANGWTGLKLKKAVKVDQIKFLPRNDDNGIDIGQKYQLDYWNNGRWVTLYTKVADDAKLIVSNIPSGSLLLLHNLTKGKEERIFTYEKGKQIWW